MRVLMATGGSAHSELALRFSTYILALDQSGAAPTVVTVIKHEADRPRAEAILRRAIELLGAAAPEVQPRIRVGHPAEEILREAEEGAYDLVIVGEKQHHGLITRFVLGSTAERVVEYAPCPVLVAKGQIAPVQHLLLCDSGFQDPPLLERLTTQLADLVTGKQKTTVLHVMSQISAGPGVSGQQLRASAETLIAAQTPEGQLLARDLQLLARLNAHPHPKIRHGFVVDEILAEACSDEYQLVVIGANRGQGWRRILLDDLAHQVITQVNRPVLVVR